MVGKLFVSLFDLRIPPAAPVRWFPRRGRRRFLIVVFWFLASTALTHEQRWVSPVILPSPLEGARSRGPLWTERGLLDSIIATLRRVLAGFGLAILIRVPLGIAAGSWRALRAAVMPVCCFPGTSPLPPSFHSPSFGSGSKKLKK